MKSINAGLVVTIALPVFAIAASLNVAAIAFLRGDPTLPDEYHWEGMKLEHDFAGSQRAAALDVQAALHVLPGAHTCRVALRLDGPPPRGMQLTFTHGTRPELDWRVRLAPRDGAYEGYCESMPVGHWHLELADDAKSWSVREEVSGPLDGATLSARPHSG